MTTTRQQIKTATTNIILLQKERAAIVLTASERAEAAEVTTQLETAQGFSMSAVLRAADTLTEAQEESDAVQAQGLSDLQTTLVTTTVASRALSNTLSIMQDCAVMSEAIALERTRHEQLVSATTAEHDARTEQISLGLATCREEMDSEVANVEQVLTDKRTRRDHAAAIAMDEFLYDHAQAVEGATCSATALIEDTQTSIQREAGPRNAALDRRNAALTAQEDEVADALEVVESLDNDVENATATSRAAAIRETTKEGEDSAHIATIEWDGELKRMTRTRGTFQAEVADLLGREESMLEELAIATTELKALNTAAVGG